MWLKWVVLVPLLGEAADQVPRTLELRNVDYVEEENAAPFSGDIEEPFLGPPVEAGRSARLTEREKDAIIFFLAFVFVMTLEVAFVAR